MGEKKYFLRTALIRSLKLRVLKFNFDTAQLAMSEVSPYMTERVNPVSLNPRES